MTNYEAHIDEIKALHDEHGGSWLCIVDYVIHRETGAAAMCEADCMTCADCADRAIQWLMSDSVDERAARRAEAMRLIAPNLLGNRQGSKLETWAARAGAHESGEIMIADLPLLDTRKPELSALTLRVARRVAENDRAYRRQRQAEGIARAKRYGVKFGRPPREKPEGYEEVAAAYHRGEINGSMAAEKLGIPLSTFRYWAGKQKSPCAVRRQPVLTPIPEDEWPDGFEQVARRVNNNEIGCVAAAQRLNMRVTTFKKMLLAYNEKRGDSSEAF